jgi:hypothetical protein
VDLLNVLRTLRRFKWTTLTIVVLTLGSIAALVLAVPKVYQVDGAYVLINPSVPSDQELSTHPDLAAENRNNPYLRFTSQSMVGQVLATRMSSDDVRAALLKEGVNDEYIVAPSNDFGGAGQIINVSGVGPTPQAAAHASDAIVARMTDELRSMQKVYGAADRYMITLIAIQAPGEAMRVVSGQLRSIIAVAGAGMILLFAAISVRQAMSARRRRAPRTRGGVQIGGPRRRPRPLSEGGAPPSPNTSSSSPPGTSSLPSGRPAHTQAIRLVRPRQPSSLRSGNDIAPVTGLHHRNPASSDDENEELASAPRLAQ